MTGGRQMTDRRSLSGSLNVTAGSGIRDSEGGATLRINLSYRMKQIILWQPQKNPHSVTAVLRLWIVG